MTFMYSRNRIMLHKSINERSLHGHNCDSFVAVRPGVFETLVY